MKAYHGSFTKTNGEERTMSFVRTTDLPESFLNERVKKTGNVRVLKEGMETVWDIQAQGFRTFNWNAVVGEVEEINIEENALFSLTME
jgi:hypothetical protein